MSRALTRASVAALACILSATSCAEPRAADAGLAGATPEAGGVAVYCALNIPEVLNPFVTPDQFVGDLRLVLYSPLVRYDSAGAIAPHLARAWTWEDGQRTLVLTLRDDVRWHDGQRVTPEDVAWTVQIAADPTFAYPGGGELRGLREAAVRDSLTVALAFADPIAAGLEPFTRLVILPRHLLGDVAGADFARAEYNRAPVGSGPYRFAGRSADGAIQLDRVADFPDELGRGLLDRIVLRRVPEASAMMVELQTGGVDACITGSSRAREAQATGLRAVAVGPFGAQVIPLDTRKPPFHDARVRRALSAALIRAELAQTISPLAQPAGTFMPEGDERWTDAALRQPDDDSARAAALLDSAGWSTVGADGIRRNAAGEPLRFTVVAPQPLENLMTVVQAQLRRVGAEAELRFMEGGAYISTLMNPATRPAAMAITFFPDRYLFPDPYAELHTGGGSNLGSYSDPQVDSLTERLHDVLADDERARIYHELQRRVAEDVPALYTVYVPRLLALGSRLQAVSVDRNGPLAGAAGWWIPSAQRRRGAAGPGGEAGAATSATGS